MLRNTILSLRPLASSLLIALLAAGATTGGAAAEPAPPTGYVALFNGHDLEGWAGRPHFDPEVYRGLSEAERQEKQAEWNASFAAHWRVEDGQIVNDGHGVFCSTAEDYGDFELLLEWKMAQPGTDSGVYLRGCPQVQIWDPDHEPQWTHGSRLGSGGLWNNNPDSPGKDPLVRADNPVGEWNRLLVRVLGDRVTVRLNGALVVDDATMHNYWDREAPLYGRGPIQLQTHGGEMRFRNIYLRRLDDDPMNEKAEPVSASPAG